MTDRTDTHSHCSILTSGQFLCQTISSYPSWDGHNKYLQSVLAVLAACAAWSDWLELDPCACDVVSILGLLTLVGPLVDGSGQRPVVIEIKHAMKLKRL